MLRVDDQRSEPRALHEFTQNKIAEFIIYSLKGVISGLIFILLLVF